MGVWRKRFRGGSAAARKARRAVRRRLDGELPESRLTDVELLVSELATNSVRHGGTGEDGEIAVEADVLDDRVRLCLRDFGEGFEQTRTPRPREDGAGGYGLVLLDLLADRWGVQRDEGFCVWFEVARGRG
jgi:serine/threonine-protein kinase RsbW